MIPAYLIYRHYQKKKQNGSMAATDNSDLFPTLERVTFSLQGVTAKRVTEGGDVGEECFINGKLSIVEKPMGVMIEWAPLEDDDWVLANDDDADASLSRSLNNAEARGDVMKMKFSVDIKDLQSFNCVEPKKDKGLPWIRFHSKDGSGFVPLYFPEGGISSFTEHLQRYSTLKRSAREANLVLFTNERIEALEQSVSILDLNSDFLSRIISRPYATAMTGLGKVASFVQDQVIASILDSDAVSAEEQIKAWRELREQREREDEDAAGRLRLYDDAGFELVTQLDLPQRPEVRRDPPVTEEQWKKHKNADGSFSDVNTLKDMIFHGGLTPSLRIEAWKYMLGIYKWEYSDTMNATLKKKRSEDYYRMKLQWMTVSDEQEKRFTEFAARKALIGSDIPIEKDVIRTDRTHAFFGDKEHINTLREILMTYCMYNFDLGYVQGMSDYLSPLLVVMDNEVDAFWAFVGLMERVHGNFEMDQAAIKKQLMDLRDLLMVINPKLVNYLESHDSDDMYFCFRWVLVSFKREFCFDDVMKLWEVLWTDRPCSNFLLLVCVAILDKQMNLIIENKFGLTEILKHVNDLSMNIDLNETLATAEAIFLQLTLSQDKLPPHICKILSLRSTSDGS